jgi:hypothetical protein
LNYSVPIPLEDELAFGLLGRFAQLNGFLSHEWAVKSLKACGVDNEKLPVLWRLALACGIDRDDFVTGHSMLPVMYPISSYRGSARESNYKRHRSLTYGMYVPSGELRWCAECTQQDNQERGFSHWRRRHQITGVDWCFDHRAPLLHSTHAAGSSFPPLRNQELSGILNVSRDEVNNPALHRLQEILFSWLLRPQPIHLRAWTDVVGQRCRLLGLRVGEIGKRAVVSDCIYEQFPKSWLNKHFPEIATKEPKAYVRKVDGACIDKHLSYPALACAAIIAALYQSAEEGLTALNDADVRLAAPQLAEQPINSAISAFLSGMGLQQACNKAGVDLRDVEVQLRNSFLEMSRCILSSAQMDKELFSIAGVSAVKASTLTNIGHDVTEDCLVQGVNAPSQ